MSHHDVFSQDAAIELMEQLESDWLDELLDRKASRDFRTFARARAIAAIIVKMNDQFCFSTSLIQKLIDLMNEMLLDDEWLATWLVEKLIVAEVEKEMNDLKSLL